MLSESVFTISLIIAAIALLALIAGFFNIGKSIKALKDFFGEELLGRSVRVRSGRASIAILSAEFVIICSAIVLIFFSQNKRATPNDNASKIIFCLDISKSMDCRDQTPSRLNYAKNLIAKTIQKSSNTDIAIIGFAGEAVTLMPVTSDKSYGLSLVNSISTEYATNTGTDIVSALEKAKTISQIYKDKNCKVVLISDGENFVEGKSIPSFDNNVEFYAVCIGSKSGGKIPTQSGFYKDISGNEVITKSNPEYMQQIAKKMNGLEINSSTIESDISALFAKNESNGFGDGLMFAGLAGLMLLLAGLEIFRHK